MHALGQLDSAAQRIPNPRLISHPTIRREAVSTSALEGTYTTLPQILEAEALEDEPTSRDVDEVRRFVRTAEYAFDAIRDRPLSEALIKELHSLLMRGDARCPPEEQGRYRTRQNFIGPRRGGVVGSFFVPPPPGDPVQDAMDDWIQWRQQDNVPLLIRVAIGHYQFETIHPFFDGNGRIGRLLIVLQLLEGQKLAGPVLEISPFFEDRRDEYQEHLRSLSATGDFDPWVSFFSEGVRVQSEVGLRKIDDLLGLKDEMLGRLHQQKVRGVAIQLAEYLIGIPVIVPAQVAKEFDITYQAAVNAIERLEELDILERVITKKKRRRLYVAPRVLDVVNL